MSIDSVEIEKHLIAAIADVDSITPRSYPNHPLIDTPDGLWLQINNVRLPSTPITLGVYGQDNHPGILQIDINYPEGAGTRLILSKCDEFINHFTSGFSIPYHDNVITVLSSSSGHGRYVGGYYRMSVSVNYFAMTARN